MRLVHLLLAACPLGLITFWISTLSNVGLLSLNPLSIASDKSAGYSINSPCPPNAFTIWSYLDGSKSVATAFPNTLT